MFKGFQIMALAAVLACAGCATTPLYHPATSARSTGYSDTPLGGNRYRVTFVGADTTPASVVQDYVLLRAAELTLSKGASWFTVVSRQTVPQSSGRSQSYYTGGFGPPYCGYYGCWGGPYGGLIIEHNAPNRLAASLEIMLGQGTMPANTPNAYDANQLINAIRAKGVQ
jgi:hypothetical protein